MATEDQKHTDEEREAGEADSSSEDRDDAATASAAEDAAEAEGASEADSEDGDDAAEGEGGGASAAEIAAASTPAARAARASAGARLAAAKAAKAAKKAARRAQDAAANAPPATDGGPPPDADEILAQSALGRAAAGAGKWAEGHRQIAMGVAGVILVGVAGWVGYTWWSSSQAEAAGALLSTAVEIANADIEVAGASETESATADDADDDALTFETREARAEAALTAYRRVLSEAPSSDAARWARLGEARAQFDLGHMDEARSAYEAALRESGRDPVVAWRALEGIGFTYEVAQQWQEAISKYEELRSVDDGAFAGPADYHIARMRMALGETVEATTALRGLVERLNTASAGEEPDFPFVLAQAEIRLRELDPGAASGGAPGPMIGPGGGGMPGGLEGLPPGLEGVPPEILEQIRQQLQKQPAGGGEGGGGEGAGGGAE